MGIGVGERVVVGRGVIVGGCSGGLAVVTVVSGNGDAKWLLVTLGTAGGTAEAGSSGTSEQAASVTNSKNRKSALDDNALRGITGLELIPTIN